MKVMIRTDSSSVIGSGHLMRCLTLAGRFRAAEANVVFFSRDWPGNLCHKVEDAGYRCQRLEGNKNSGTDFSWEDDAEQTLRFLETEDPIDWLIADHYGIDCRWERILHRHVDYIMVIDDLADRRHVCDLLLDQNLHANVETRYKELVPEHCRLLLGPAYALLRPEFIAARRHIPVREGQIRRIMIFMGGADPFDLTSRALEAVRMVRRADIPVDVIVGAANPNRDRIESLCRSLPGCTCHHDVERMVPLMAAADLAIGAGGTSTWERCCLGLPAIVVQIADNQRELTETLADRHAVWNLGWHTDVTTADFKQQIEYALDHPHEVRAVSAAAAAIMDVEACGGADRVVEAMLEKVDVAH